ncbi:hypothetical protein DRE_07241 [Drechslerella stenobrocha 248]|uniref:Mitochondrial distribution and morphology protein 12 n=1 Tax=Drechslerella stenobrocha 248 TaxID=1043628 RepID=W7HLC5_9PEZI|nr:hypothetical protein DRE_07241 [Drechslerella stenobrocha 248]
MAVDINWPALTTGPDGKVYADALCGFFHDKFQQIPFPKFLRSVSVVSFNLGTIPPEIEIQDITDPYPEFYEDAYAECDDEDEEFDGEAYNSPEEILKRARERRRRERREGLSDFDGSYHDDTARSSAPPTPMHGPLATPIGLQPPAYIDHRYPGFRTAFSPAVDQFTSPTLRGPASNLYYFHSALTSGFTGGLTPLASLQQASAETFPGQSPLYSRSRRQQQMQMQSQSGPSSTSPSQSPPSTADSSNVPAPVPGNPRLTISSDDTHHTDGTREPPPTPFSDVSISTQQQQQQQGQLPSPLDSPSPPSEHHHAPRLGLREPRDSDIQIIARVRYAGDIRMELTAELLLDYPAPSFVSLPVRLTVTGMAFDGTAVIAHIGKRAHFCFVDNEHEHGRVGINGSGMGGDGIASMLKEIRIDSEIGEKGRGKQVLKNVGKVRDFVLDRVRRILEDEFVFPSSWTFLL